LRFLIDTKEDGGKAMHAARSPLLPDSLAFAFALVLVLALAVTLALEIFLSLSIVRSVFTGFCPSCGVPKAHRLMGLYHRTIINTNVRVLSKRRDDLLSAN